MILSNYAIKFRIAVFVFILVLVIAGSYSYVSLPREGSPDITISHVFVSAYYEGTAPSEMEKLVTIPLEESLNAVENVKEMRSTTSESSCNIDIEFVAGEDIDLARQRVKDKIDLAKPDLPEDLDEPIVFAFNFSSDFPIFIFALSGETDIQHLKSLAEDLQTEIELLPGVKEADISGTSEREIRVEIDLPRLAAYNIPVSLVMGTIAAENTTLSAGNLELEGDKFQVRVPGEFRLVSELEDLILCERNGSPVYVGDVATVLDTEKDLQSVSRLNGNPCVSVSVKKRTRQNSVALIDDVKKVVDAFTLPPGVELTVVMDESEYVDMMIEELENNIASGFILVVLVLFVFMGGRNSLFVALAIPLSMLIAFAVMSLLGFTLNMIVLFSLVLSVGMLVDNAIVIVENIFRNRTIGKSAVEAARIGAGEVAWPVITSTLTTCAAFSPLLLWPDVIGQFMSFLPKTLIVTLSASLFVAIVINPAVCSAFIAKNGQGGKKRSRGHSFMRFYEGMLRGALAHRVPVLLIGIGFLLLTVQLYGRYGKGIELFPDIEPRNATVNVKFAQGTGIDRTDDTMRLVEGKLGKYDDVKFFLTTVGAPGATAMMAGGGGTHMAQIHVEFLEASERSGNTSELVGTIRDEIGLIPGAEVKVEKQKEGPPTGSPISIELSGDDFDTLSELSAKVIRAIETVPGLVDLQDDFEEALPELQVKVDRHRSAMLGLDTGTIAGFLRTSIYGIESSKFRADEEEYDITLRVRKDQRESFSMLDRILIPLNSGKSIPLSSVCSVEYRGGRGSITRKDQKRVITIGGNNQGRGVDKILLDVQARVSEITLPRGYTVAYAGDNQEMVESGTFLKRAFGVAIGLILVILVVQFNSAALPSIIVTSVLLSLIGVMWGLLICQLRFGVIMTGLGVISLAGIVVNNAIVLVDCIHRRVMDGMTPDEAAVTAGKLRLRPVLLTAATTILGLIPMAIGYSLEVHEWPPRIVAGAESSAWWAPMAVAVIFGLGVATVLTLVLVPVMYSLADQGAGAFKRALGFSDEDD